MYNWSGGKKRRPLAKPFKGNLLRAPRGGAEEENEGEGNGIVRAD